MTEKLIDKRRVQMIKENISQINQKIAAAANSVMRNPTEISLMAVTKTVEPEFVNVAINEGINLLGENRAQELLSKYDAYILKNESIHFIGHLQRNKVKSIINKVGMIESVDSVELAREIDKQSKKHNLIMPVLIEVNIGLQESKNGVLPENLEQLLYDVSQFENISVQGLMAIPPMENVDKYFKNMQRLYIDIKDKKIDNININHLSIGMSSDYESAIKYGATIVRIGSAIFGNRI